LWPFCQSWSWTVIFTTQGDRIEAEPPHLDSIQTL
jgi:hypothetical protein